MLTNPLTAVKFVLEFVLSMNLTFPESLFCIYVIQCFLSEEGRVSVRCICTQARCLLPSILIYLIKICLVHVPNFSSQTNTRCLDNEASASLLHCYCRGEF